MAYTDVIAYTWREGVRRIQVLPEHDVVPRQLCGIDVHLPVRAMTIQAINYTDLNYIGHDYTGHDYTCHNCIGHDYAWHNCIGHSQAYWYERQCSTAPVDAVPKSIGMSMPTLLDMPSVMPVWKRRRRCRYGGAVGDAGMEAPSAMPM